ncbi:recombinase family protein [Neobacillus niacini]|uniref:recombinase family protein n=1 Tax=Neobacillus niacini TaxID=86668 RepID=UPI002869FF2A|nr:recombinase family protein [Neobacillus niacini]
MEFGFNTWIWRQERELGEMTFYMAGVVKRLFQLKQKNKKWSLSRLAEALNDEGYQTTQGKAFTKVQVKRFLYRESFYQGIYTYGQIQANGKHQAII